MIFNVLGGMASRAMQKRDEQDALANRLKLESEIMAIKEGYQQRALAREQASRDRKEKKSYSCNHVHPIFFRGIITNPKCN